MLRRCQPSVAQRAKDKIIYISLNAPSLGYTLGGVDFTLGEITMN